MAKNILNEAIADAKAVREVALANAKAALEEAFTPKLQSMLSAKLSEELEDDEDDELDLDEMMTYDEDEDIEESMTYEEDEDITGMDEEIDLEEILSELDLEEGGEEDMDEDMYDEDMYEDQGEVNEDFNLDRLLEEINNLDEMKGGGDECDCGDGTWGWECCPQNAKPNNDFYTPFDPMNPFPRGPRGPRIPGIDDVWYEGMDEDMYDEDMYEGNGEQSNESILGALAGIAGLFAAAGGFTKLEMMFEDPAIQEKYPFAKKVLGWLQKRGKDAAGSMSKTMKETYNELDETYDELYETKKAYKTVRSELNEVNLLNSKLLYVNRIFKANQLDEEQKLRVVETLDKAGSVKESKLIYETIKDTFTISKEKKRTPKSYKKSIREGLGMASRSSGTTQSVARNKAVLNESNDMVSRMQKLANIKINQ